MFRAGVLINSGDAIERVAEVDHAIFDKTGDADLRRTRCGEFRFRAGRLFERWQVGSRWQAIIRSPRRWRARRREIAAASASPKSRGRGCAAASAARR